MSEDDDFLDGCELDFTKDAVDDKTAALLPLFPDGQPDADKARFWRELAAKLDGPDAT